MGCQLSRPARRGRSKHYDVPGNKEEQPPTNTAASSASQFSDPPARKKLDPQDFMFSGLASVTQVKLPGAVQGQQFIIDNCKDCTLVVLDHCAAVTIDDCTNCKILIGPTESSVFMRDCNNCTLAAITQQLRCRDCTDCSLLLLCRTRPIIESSSGMAFGCYDAPYAGLAAQMAAAKLSPFHNFWSDVYDFTPAGAAPAAAPAAAAAGGSSTPAVGPAVRSAQQHQSSRNWQLLPEAASVEQMLGGPALPQDVLSLLGSTAGTAATVAVCADAQAACSCSEPAGKPQEQEQLSTSGGGSSSSTSGGGSSSSTSGGSSSSTSGGSSSSTSGGSSSSTSATGGAAPVAKAAGHGTAAAVQASSPGAASSCNPAVPEADRMCVIRSGRCSIGQQESGSACGRSSSRSSSSHHHHLFALFPAGQHTAALQWVHDSITKQQQQQGRQGPQEDKPAAGEPCLAAADPADIQLSCSTTAGPTQDPAACSAAAAAEAVLLHTNEASIPAPVLQQMAAAAGWNKQQLRALGAGRSEGMMRVVGLEVLCVGEATGQRLRAAAEAGGALCCTDAAAAAQLFRDRGMDG